MWFRKIKKKNLSSTKTRPKDENYKKIYLQVQNASAFYISFNIKKCHFHLKVLQYCDYIYTHTYIYEKYLLTVLIFIGSHILNCYSYNSEKKRFN